MGVIESPLLGPKGNKEFLLHLQKREDESSISPPVAK